MSAKVIRVAMVMVTGGTAGWGERGGGLVWGRKRFLHLSIRLRLSSVLMHATIDGLTERKHSRGSSRAVQIRLSMIG